MDKVIGFVGTGVMGAPMVQNLMKAGYKVYIYTRTRSKASHLLDEGAHWCSSPQEVAQKSPLIITILGYPKDVEQVYLGYDGLLANAAPQSILVDMTTSDPALAKRLAEEAKKHQLYCLDAPVTGGDIGAKNGTLSIMVGGQEEAFQKVMPILEILGNKAIFQGPPGSGQHSKMVNQIAIAAGMVAVSEALNYAKDANLDPNKVLESISEGAAGSWTLRNLAPRMLAGDTKPGFFVKHFIKDMTLAIKNAKEQHTHTPGLELALKLYEDYAQSGGEEHGTQGLHQFLDSLPPQ